MTIREVELSSLEINQVFTVSKILGNKQEQLRILEMGIQPNISYQIINKLGNGKLVIANDNVKLAISSDFSNRIKATLQLDML
jgi:Fe2+ transport system protein FeoA